MFLEWLQQYGDAALTGVGFFWKAGWAFVLGYAISAMIQVFVPKERLTQGMGGTGVGSLSLATAFGAISSSCSFAALAAARALIAKGASIVAGIAFMFASTNLVIELGILIFIFLGWPFLVAELLGGLVLIAISTSLVRLTAPDALLETIREAAEEDAPDEPDDFDWRRRIRSLDGWKRVGHQFVMEWGMVWEEILIGFTIAGFMAVLVPDSFWQALFLTDVEGVSSFWVALENALVAPLVAASTFIGSMGNIPLATVLASSGAAFAGVMAFIYSDLMVPPLVRVNATYYGWKGALYIAGIMYVSIVATALLLNFGLSLADITVESQREPAETARFALDYSFVLNVVFAVVAMVLVWLHRQQQADMEHEGDGGHEHDGGEQGLSLKRIAVYLALVCVLGGLVVKAVL